MNVAGLSFCNDLFHRKDFRGPLIISKQTMILKYHSEQIFLLRGQNVRLKVRNEKEVFCRSYSAVYIFFFLFCCSILMDFYPMDEDRAAPQDRKPFENLQNALQCVIRSFVESPQVMNNTNSLSLPCFLAHFLT